MRASAKYLTGLLALGLSMGGAAASAVEPTGVSHSSMMTTTWFLQAQPGQRSAPLETARQKAATWLDVAEKAMQKGDWQGASIAIGKAEELEQQIPANEPPLSFRPADARRKLASMQGLPQQTPLMLPNTNQGMSMDQRKMEASRLLAQAQAAMDRNDLESARQLTAKAVELRVPDDMFQQSETLPWQMELKVRSAMSRSGTASQAGFQGNTAGGNVRQGDYQAQGMGGQVRPVSGEQDGNPYTSGYQGTIQTQGIRAQELVDMARRAHAAGDAISAREYYRQALRFQDQLDPQLRQFVRDQLANLAPAQQFTPQDGNALEQIDAQEQMILQRIGQDIFRERAVAERMTANRDPRGALAHLQQLRERVAMAQIDDAKKQHFLNIVDREIRDAEQYIELNIVQIRNDEENAQNRQDVRDYFAGKQELEYQLKELIDQFNSLVDEGRIAEAEVIARQAKVLAPEYPEVEVITWKATFLNRMQQMNMINEAKESGVFNALQSVDEAGIPFDDRNPMLFGDAQKWEQLTARRRREMIDGTSLSAADMRLLQQLRTTMVNVNFVDQPLTEVLRTLAIAANVNIDTNAQALAAEGVATDTPITIQYNNDVSLGSALANILKRFHLTYEVRDEVVMVTTHEMKRQNVYQDTYYVGDLVIPIPNFVPTSNMGLTSALATAYRTASMYGAGGSGYLPGLAAGDPSQAPGALNATTLAQALPDSPFNNPMGGGPAMGAMPSGNSGYGPGGMGGGIVADYDSLIELIENTVSPESWEAVGGPGTMSPFQQNLSLVISQTQEVHEQIQDLLDQLRRLQDLQITIEVRFITLQDDFFERIGVDFDFDIRHGSMTPQNPDGTFNVPTAGGPTVTIGRQSVSNIFTPTADLDLQFAQDSFASAVPQFGGFDANTAANFGFAILSDIEVFMLLQASKGDTRTNILQAPKVTLFNGQTASVNDTAQRPFVTSIVPVVGDFAAAYQPVVVVLNEGTQLSVQAVTSRDRRFVRMTLVPFFSQIGDVEEFTFTGSTTTTTGSAVVDPTNPNNTLTDNASVTTAGTTVQLPVFGFTSVSTTVSVPDGGTVLLGGIKRLQEGRNERGVPVLSNVPYVSRLFKNVGIGRTSQSLMMMVTPRIIIQEEEEQAQVGGGN